MSRRFCRAMFVVFGIAWAYRGSTHTLHHTGRLSVRFLEPKASYAGRSDHGGKLGVAHLFRVDAHRPETPSPPRFSTHDVGEKSS